VCHPHCMSV